MIEQFESAAERAIKMMRENLGEQLTVDDMARVAMFSKFHFTRIFQRVTGVTPRRFLSALRLQQAKVLLLTTSMNVADISVHVGYNSIGTFSSRFTRSVGMSPTEYRRSGGFIQAMQPEDPDEDMTRAVGTVSGTLSVEPPYELDTVFLGLFKTCVPEGRPVRCLTQKGSDPFVLNKVPRGTWYVLCHGVVAPTGDGATPPLFVGTGGPVVIGDETNVDLNVSLAPVSPLDPPMLLALPDARTAVVPPNKSRRRPGPITRHQVAA